MKTKEERLLFAECATCHKDMTEEEIAWADHSERPMWPIELLGLTCKDCYSKIETPAEPKLITPPRFGMST